MTGQPPSGGSGLQLRLQWSPNTTDVFVDGVDLAARRALLFQELDHVVDGDQADGPDQKQSEDRALLGRSYVRFGVAAPGPQRAEHAETDVVRLGFQQRHSTRPR